jgi:hypothetical protein
MLGFCLHAGFLHREQIRMTHAGQHSNANEFMTRSIVLEDQTHRLARADMEECTALESDAARLKTTDPKDQKSKSKLKLKSSNTGSPIPTAATPSKSDSKNPSAVVLPNSSLENLEANQVAHLSLSSPLPSSSAKLSAHSSSTAALPSSSSSTSHNSAAGVSPLSNNIYTIAVPYVLKPTEELRQLSDAEQREQAEEDQEFLEQLAVDSAVAAYQKTSTAMFSLNKGSQMAPEQKIVQSWYEPLRKQIGRDFETLKIPGHTEGRKLASQHLAVLEPLDTRVLAVLTLQSLLNSFLSLKDTTVTKTVEVVMALELALRDELRVALLNRDRPLKLKQLRSDNQINSRTLRQALAEEELDAEEFRKRQVLSAAAHLVQRAIEIAKLPTVNPDGTTTLQPAFRLRVLRLNAHSRLGVIQPHANLVEVRRSVFFLFLPPFLPFFLSSLFLFFFKVI